MQIHRSSLKEIVVGSTLPALLYAYYTGAPVIYIEEKIPFRFDYFDAYFDLDKIILQSEPKEFVTLDRKKLLGHPKRDVWEKLFFMLSISGQIPFGDKVKSIRLEDNLKVITRKTNELDFNKVRIFDDDKIQGIPKKSEEKEGPYVVYDWINVHSGASHGLHYIDDVAGSVIEEIIFYPSDRIDGNHNKKDIVCVSKMTDEQLNDYRFSDTYVRFKVEKLMKEAGIRGTRNGRDQLNPEKYKYYALKIESVERQFKRVGFSHTSDNEDVILDSRTPEEIIKCFRGRKPEGYLGKLTECLQNHISI
tara:strand:+ start:697 stop:1611 length:915 start_codon:yes stop_codon:yes gene_type:complete